MYKEKERPAMMDNNIDEIYDFGDEDANMEIDSEKDEEIQDNHVTAYDIAVFYNTYNLSTLLKWWGNKLVIPDFQRSYVWDIKKASEFVDTILRGMPAPSMFFYDDTDSSRLLVVDGQQRLTSLYRFIVKKEFSGKPFKLTGNIHPAWENRSYDELEQVDRDRLDDALMNITVIRQLMPDDGQSAMYMVFQRLNTGGISLKAQEIRMAVSYGPLAKFIDEKARDKRFEKWRFLRTSSQRQNGNYTAIQELLLKFWAYYFCYPKYSGASTRALLDSFFDQQKFFDEPVKPKQGVVYHSKQEFEDAFNAAFDVVNALSLKDISPYSKPTQTFLESIWVGLTYRKLALNKGIDVERLPLYISKWEKTIGEEQFSILFQARRTSSTQSAFERIKAGIEYFSGDFDA